MPVHGPTLPCSCYITGRSHQAVPPWAQSPYVSRKSAWITGREHGSGSFGVSSGPGSGWKAIWSLSPAGFRPQGGRCGPGVQSRLVTERKQAAILTELSLMLAAIFWGTSYAATKYAAEFIPPLLIVAFRFTVGGTLMYCLLRSLTTAANTGLIFAIAPLCGTAVGLDARAREAHAQGAPPRCSLDPGGRHRLL
jgi:hypothetical protein